MEECTDCLCPQNKFGIGEEQSQQAWYCFPNICTNGDACCGDGVTGFAAANASHKEYYGCKSTVKIFVGLLGLGWCHGKW